MPIPESCPACGGPLSPWRSVPASDPALGGQSIDLLRCARCGSAVTGAEAAPDLHDLGAYGPGAPRLEPTVRPLLRRFDRQRLSLISSLAPPPGRLLDVGAGRGRFVTTALAAGYEASGIEPSRRGVEAASAIGAPVERSTIESAAIAESAFDVISLWHVLEHLEDPFAALERMVRWLRPNGIILVGVPNLQSVQARLGGAHWYHLDVPRHRIHFTPRGLDDLLARARLEVMSVHHLLLEHNPFGMWQSLVTRLTRHPSYLYNLLKRNAPLLSPDLALTLAAVPLLPLAALLELAAGLAGRGGTIAVVARRAG